MTNLLTVVEPDEGASEVATETRAKLQAWADKHLPDVAQDVIAPLSDETIKELRQFGVQELSASQAKLATSKEFKPLHQFGSLLAGLCCSTRQIFRVYSRASKPRELSYAFEGAVKDFHKQFFQAGMKWNPHAEYLALAGMQVPHTTSGYVDRVVLQQLGNTDVYNSGTPASVGQAEEGQWRPISMKNKEETLARFSSIADWLVQQARVGPNDMQYWKENLTGFSTVGSVIAYMEADGPWVAGFLNVDDACKLRYRRIRLGAYLTEHGLSDAQVRSRVEQAKQVVAGANFMAYPNDTLWEDLYTSGPNSCMSDKAGEYETWDGHHPTSAYASSYHGCGDNGLVLVVSTDKGQNVTGRGILNVHNGDIVRWYGDPVAERVLLRNEVNASNRGGIQGLLAGPDRARREVHSPVRRR